MMKKITAKVFIVLLAWFILNSCNNSQTNADNEQSKTELNSDTLKLKDQTKREYQCPMKCEEDKTYAEAGICPECEMDLAELK